MCSLVAALSLMLHGAGIGAVQPAITNFSVLPDGTLQMQLLVQVGESYTFEISRDLVNWEPVAGVEDVPTNVLTVVDDTPITSSPSRFYRMRVGRYQRFDFAFMHFCPAGQFQGSSTTPTVVFPAAYNGYRARFAAEGDAPYPEPSNVFFTGPAGSGIFSVVASTENSEFDEFGAEYYTVDINSTTGAPEGVWTVNYRGTNITYNLAFPPLSRLIVPVPTLTLNAGLIKSVSWVYRDRTTGQTIANPPAFMSNVHVQMEGDSGRIYNSPYEGDPRTTTHVLTSDVSWSAVRGMQIVYDDLDGNHYVVAFLRQ
jgi:hypothetical protein